MKLKLWCAGLVAAGLVAAGPAALADPAPKSAFPVLPAPEHSTESPPPEFPRRTDGSLDKEALFKELRARSTTPQALAEQARRVREETNEPGDRIHPFFGSERVLFTNLDESQGSLLVLYRAVSGARWYLAAVLAGLVIFVIGANWLRWRRLEKTYLQDPATPPDSPQA